MLNGSLSPARITELLCLALVGVLVGVGMNHLKQEADAANAIGDRIDRPMNFDACLKLNAAAQEYGLESQAPECELEGAIE